MPCTERGNGGVVAGAEAAKMASRDNARLRDVNVELVKVSLLLFPYGQFD